MIELGASTEGTGLEVRADLDAQVLRVVLQGSAERDAHGPLRTICGKLHEQALAARVVEVALDFTQLEFMSASCFRCLVAWVTQIRDLSPDTQYKLRLRSSPEHPWQRRSVHVLQTFATELVTVEA